MKRLNLSLSSSLQSPTHHTCSECLNFKPTCNSCNSSRLKLDSGFGYDFSSCYDCGYTIESIVNLDKIPKRLQGVLSEEAMAFADETGAPYEFFNCDEITLKTMIRSNPGLLVIKDGTILGKWHFNDIPSPEEFQNKFDLN